MAMVCLKNMAKTKGHTRSCTYTRTQIIFSEPELLLADLGGKPEMETVVFSLGFGKLSCFKRQLSCILPEGTLRST